MDKIKMQAEGTTVINGNTVKTYIKAGEENGEVYVGLKELTLAENYKRSLVDRMKRETNGLVITASSRVGKKDFVRVADKDAVRDWIASIEDDSSEVSVVEQKTEVATAEARQASTINYVQVLSQFPTYVHKGGNGWMLVLDICNKSGYANTKHFTNLVVDNQDELITLRGAELEEFKEVNKDAITQNVIPSKVSQLSIIGPNAFVEAVNRSTIPYFKSVREQNKDVLLRYIKGETVSLKNDLQAEVKTAPAPSLDIEAITKLVSTTVVASMNVYFQQMDERMEKQMEKQINARIAPLQEENVELQKDLNEAKKEQNKILVRGRELHAVHPKDAGRYIPVNDLFKSDFWKDYCEGIYKKKDAYEALANIGAVKKDDVFPKSWVVKDNLNGLLIACYTLQSNAQDDDEPIGFHVRFDKKRIVEFWSLIKPKMKYRKDYEKKMGKQKSQTNALLQ